MMENNNWSPLKTAALMGFLAVGIGAMGAHAIKPHLTDYQLNIFETGVRFHFFHALALLGTAVLIELRGNSGNLKWAVRLFTSGIICFSGSLYLLATRDLLPFPVAWAGPVTPIGGVLFMAGWAMLFFQKTK